MLRRSAFALLVVVGSLLNVSPAAAQGGGAQLQGQPIYVQNNTNRAIWVAARYCPPGSSSYVNDGFWKIEPGQKTLILYNNAVWMYLHARDEQGPITKGNGNPVTETIRGLTVDLYPYDTGTDYNPRVWTVGP